MRDQHKSQQLTPEYYESIGRMILSFQALEDAISGAIYNLTLPEKRLKPNVDLFLMINELSFKNRLKLLRNHSERNDSEYYLWVGCPKEKERRDLIPDILRQLREMLSKAAYMEEKRNQIIHSMWSPSDDGVSQMARRLKIRAKPKKISISNEMVSQESILELAEEMQTLRNSISNASRLLSGLLKEKIANQPMEGTS